MSDLPPRAILFDLDGTLLDTAPDLAGALNRLRLTRGLAPLPFSAIRPFVSHGSFALTRLGFDLVETDPQFEPLRLRLLDEYHAQIADHTLPFDGIPETLAWLQARDLRWGIVTNKPGWLTIPLLKKVGLEPPGCVVSGDTLAICKPHPAPLLHASGCLGVTPSACYYVGDAERDVEAGRRAGMQTLIALYGYLGTADRPETWGADGMLASPQALRPWLEQRWAALGL